MKVNKKSYSVTSASAFLILFLILVSSTSSAVTEQGASLTINETQITTSGSACCPSIYGDRIVWEDWRNGNRDIYMYNISTKKEVQITTNKSAQTNPVVYGDKIVWLDMRNGENTDDFFYGGQDVYMYDLSTKKETRITSSTFEISPDFSATLDIYDNRIMWCEGRGFTIYNISTKKETYTETTYGTYYPVFYGNWVIYRNEMSLGEGGDIFACDLSTKKETEIVNNNAAGRPAIYGDRVVWADARSSEDWPYENWDIYMYNLSTQKETQITTNGSAGDPVIYGDKILWVDGRSGSREIYMYNISTHTETHTTNTSASVQAINGDKIVWSDWENEKPNVYMGTLTSSNLPTASFSASPASGKTPLNVKFTDKSTGTPKKWKWDFGDGTTSTKQNPIHKYSKVGVYTVKLTVTNAAGSNTVTKTDYIKVIAKPVAVFSAYPTSGKAPLNVKFTDTSTGIPASWYWNFGDGSKSYLQNPVHKYSKAGTYTVNLIVKNAAGRNEVTKTEYIKVISKPVASFSGSPTSGKTPLNIKFTDTSTGIPASWYWNFGDGSKSYLQNSVHKYSKAGVYTVSLTVKNAAGRSTLTKTGYIKVISKPVASFSASPTSGKAPLNVKFTDTSIGIPASWYWNFGDGSKSYLQNPVHKYSKAGVYNVSLTVKNAAGRSMITKTSYIKII